MKLKAIILVEIEADEGPSYQAQQGHLKLALVRRTNALKNYVETGVGGMRTGVKRATVTVKDEQIE
jgi:hypothetical protein